MRIRGTRGFKAFNEVMRLILAYDLTNWGLGIKAHTDKLQRSIEIHLLCVIIAFGWVTPLLIELEEDVKAANAADQLAAMFRSFAQDATAPVGPPLQRGCNHPGYHHTHSGKCDQPYVPGEVLKVRSTDLN